MSCSRVVEGAAGAEEFLPLIMISWDVAERRPIVAFSTDPWAQLSIEEEESVFGELCSLALEFAPFAIPDDLRSQDWRAE